jgi:hypothetical protein
MDQFEGMATILGAAMGHEVAGWQAWEQSATIAEMSQSVQLSDEIVGAGKNHSVPGGKRKKRS